MVFIPSKEDSAMAAPAPQDRRRPNRLPFLRFITYGLSVPGAPDTQPQKNQAAAINVSDGGLCLLVTELMNEADIIRLDLPLADVATTSSTLAEVKWLKAVPWATKESPEYFVGVRFLL
jgi:hypothetical protein